MINPMFQGNSLIPNIFHFLWYFLGAIAVLLIIFTQLGKRRGRG